MQQTIVSLIGLFMTYHIQNKIGLCWGTKFYELKGFHVSNVWTEVYVILLFL